LHELFVTGEEGKPLDSRLGQQYSIKRIGMNGGQFADSKHMRRPDRKLAKSGIDRPLSQSCRINQEILPTKTTLDDDFQDACHAEKDVTCRIGDDAPSLGAQRRGIQRGPQQHVGIQQVRCQGAPKDPAISSAPIRSKSSGTSNIRHEADPRCRRLITDRHDASDRAATAGNDEFLVHQSRQVGLCFMHVHGSNHGRTHLTPSLVRLVQQVGACGGGN